MAFSALVIGNNTLSLNEVAIVLDGKIVAEKQAEIKEAKNAYETYDSGVFIEFTLSAILETIKARDPHQEKHKDEYIDKHKVEQLINVMHVR